MNGAVFAFMLAQATKRHFVMLWPEIDPYFHSVDRKTTISSYKPSKLRSCNVESKYRSWTRFNSQKNVSYILETNTPYQNALLENPILRQQLERQGWHTVERRDLPACVMQHLFQANSAITNINKDTTIRNLPIVSQLADAFTNNKMFERYFPSENPTSRRLVKIGAYARALRNLVSCAENEVYRSIFNTINIVYIPPRVVRLNLRPMEEAFNNVIPQDSLCLETYDIVQRKDRYDRDPVLTQHAELLIAEYLSKTHHHEAYIGISQYSCHLCYQVLQKWPEQKYVVADTHGKMAAKWLPPASLPNEIISVIKTEMVQKLIDKIDLIQESLTDSDLDSIDSKAMIQTGR
jgi:hypothetical protein